MLPNDRGQTSALHTVGSHTAPNLRIRTQRISTGQRNENRRIRASARNHRQIGPSASSPAGSVPVVSSQVSNVRSRVRSRYDSQRVIAPSTTPRACKSARHTSIACWLSPTICLAIGGASNPERTRTEIQEALRLGPRMFRNRIRARLLRDRFARGSRVEILHGTLPCAAPALPRSGSRRRRSRPSRERMLRGFPCGRPGTPWRTGTEIAAIVLPNAASLICSDRGVVSARVSICDRSTGQSIRTPPVIAQ